MAEVKNYGAIDLNALGNKSKKTKNYNNRNISFQSESPIDKLKDKITKACIRDGGKYITIKDSDYAGILIGAGYHRYLDIDNYPCFIVINKDRKIDYIPGDTRYILLKNVPGDLSVLNYIWIRDRTSIYENIMNIIDTDKMFTPVYIDISEKPKNKKSDKNKKYKN